MISGFDDPDTHMAVLDSEGTLLAASPGFHALSMTPQTCRALVTAVGRDSRLARSSGRSPPARAICRRRSENFLKTPPCICFSPSRPVLGNISTRARISAEVEENGVNVATAAVSGAAAPLLSAARLPDDVVDEIETIEEIPGGNERFTHSLETPDAESADVASTGTVVETPVDDLPLQETEQEAVPADTLVSHRGDRTAYPSTPTQHQVTTYQKRPTRMLTSRGLDCPPPGKKATSARSAQPLPAETEDLAEQPTMPVAEPAVETRTETEKDEPEEAPLNDEAAVAVVENASEEAFLDEASAANAAQGFVFNPNSRADAVCLEDRFRRAFQRDFRGVRDRSRTEVRRRRRPALHRTGGAVSSRSR